MADSNKLAVGQLRQWKGLPPSRHGEHQAEALLFRITKIEGGMGYGDYEPKNEAGFTQAEIEHMERFSVVVG